MHKTQTILLAALLLATGIASGTEDHPMGLTLRSPAFGSGGEIPTLHTCDGSDVSPPLSWSGVPSGTQSLVLIVDDPDVPDPAAPQRTWVHWVLYNIPPSAGGLAQGMQPQSLPAGTRQGLNDWQRSGYGGPCPPIGSHRYFHKLYALDTVITVDGQPTKSALERAMQGHVIEQVELIGRYRRR